MLGNSDIVLRNMNGLREMGVRLALDDFGTGHSSLTYLRRFPFDRIKIDRSFIQNLSRDVESKAIVASVLTLGRSLRMSVLAEGVETEGQLDELRAMRCEQVQGYLLGRPMAPEAARELAAAGMATKKALVDGEAAT